MDICTIIIATVTTLQMCYSEPVCTTSADGTKRLCYQGHECGGIHWPTYDCKRPDGSSYTFEDKNALQGGTVIYMPATK